MIPAVMLAAALVTIAALARRRWQHAILAAAVLAGLLMLTPDGQGVGHSLAVFATAAAQ